MRIALDATYSVGDNLSGIGVYSNEILGGLAAGHPDVSFDFCYRVHRFLRSWRLPLPANCRRRLFGDSWTPRAALFHGLNQRLPLRAKLRRAACTFHDLFVLTGDYSTPEFRLRFAEQAREAASRSDLMIAVSRFTADQMETVLGIERTRIRVIPHGVRAIESPRPLPSREKMILHVGAVQRRKNLARLVKAFESVDAEWRLVLAGSAGYGADEVYRLIEDSPRRSQIHVLGYVDSSTLANLYRTTGLLAFPSLDEGFGMPVLEAMAAGVPVLTASRSALPEVGGDAALAVDPTSTEAIAEGLRRLTEDESLREDLVRRGFARAAMFRWEDAIRATWAVYRELLE